MIKLSAGTAHLLGMKRLKTDAPPTTAYLMAGEGCQNDCSFCAQATSNLANKNELARIRWQEYQTEDIISNLSQAAAKKDLQRICIQAVDNPQAEESITDFLDQAQVDLPVCVSKSINSLAEVDKLLEAGVDRVNIALDVVDPEKFNQIKGGSYQERYQLLEAAANRFPDRISTHIIIGFGETEKQVVKLLTQLKELKVKLGLFAFTPLRGTELAKQSRPDIDNYRRVQIANYLIYNHDFTLDQFEFKADKLTAIDIKKQRLKDLLATGKAFETVGCSGCNRPYYNEKPGGVMYNYPRSLTSQEIEEAIKESRLIEDGRE
ncbi:radical SAM protein [Natroniella sulfidigena]|uniref:radical SAM protein n=1 Tax=Natroniella sulfidigena TaxID=723921 RepID=UPI00200A701E|nr:radical SAM protein [Natroniella sulfidigena]MCK8817733.1 radical SAM protein [Natroniella sulfidigena]